MKKYQCENCKGYGELTEEIQKLINEGMVCNCSGKLKVNNKD